MRDQGRPVLAQGALLVAACSFGAAVSLFGALRAVLGAWVELPDGIALLQIKQMVWGAPIAALAAWMGGSGGAWFARRGWNPSWRVAEGALTAAVAALSVQLSGGYRFSPGTPLWAAVVVSLPAFQAVAAWSGAYWLASVMAAVLTDGRSEDAGAWSDAYRSLRARLLALALAIAGSWALASLGALGDPGGGGALALGGVVVFVLAGLLLVARVHQRMIELELRREGAKVLSEIESGGGAAGTWLLIVPAAVALLIPANLSPLRAWNFNSWMERLTERLGPLLLPSQAPSRRIGEELGRISLDRFLAELASRGASSEGVGASLALLALFFFAIVFVAWRVFRTPSRGERLRGMGRLPIGFRWLYEQIRAWVSQWFARWGARRPIPEKNESAVLDRRGQTPLRGHREYASVAAVYIDVVVRMGRRGFLRKPSETPLEYLGRYRAQAVGGDDGDFTRLTELFMFERYGERKATAGILAEARRVGVRALRFLSRGKLAAAVKSWVRDIGAKPRTGE